MFGSLIGNPTTEGTDWGAKMLDTVASRSIAQLFSQSESVDVQIRCSPSSKLLQGSIDSFKMNGRELVIRRRFPVQEMSFETDSVSIDFSSVLSGQLQLKQPTQAIAQVVLSEAGINQAFEADLVTQRLEELELPGLESLTQGKPVSFTHVKVKLKPGNRIQLTATAQIATGPEIPIVLETTVEIERRRRINFTNPQCIDESVPDELRQDSQQLSQALLEALNGMVDLDRFNLDGVKLRLNRLETHQDTLTFNGYAEISHFPRHG